MIYKTDSKILSIDAARHTVRAIVSSGEPVRGTRAITLNTAFDARLQSYLDNPVLLWCHPESDATEVAPWTVIGRALSVETTPDGLVCEFQYAVEENEQAALVWRLIEGGYLRAYSIGFMPLRIVRRTASDEEKAKLPDYARQALESGSASEVYTEVELWEVSQVWLGADRKALAQAARPSENGGVAMRDLTIPASADEKPAEKPNVQMPIRMLDAAARLERVATCLSASEWYDWTSEQRLETLVQSVAILGAVSIDIQTMADEFSQGMAEEASSDEGSDEEMQAAESPVVTADTQAAPSTDAEIVDEASAEAPAQQEEDPIDSILRVLMD